VCFKNDKIYNSTDPINPIFNSSDFEAGDLHIHSIQINILKTKIDIMFNLKSKQEIVYKKQLFAKPINELDPNNLSLLFSYRPIGICNVDPYFLFKLRVPTF